jgi:hypothetical protein
MGNAARLVFLIPAIAHADVQVRTALELGLHAPRTIAVDVWGELSERLVVGLTTSHDAQHALGAGRGLCFSRCGDRLPVLPDDDSFRYAGLAAEARLRFAADVTGRFAIDTTRFAPTPAAVELGLDLRRRGDLDVLVAPQLRLGITRRDLDENRDTGALFVELDHHTWGGGGLTLIARGAVALQALRSDPVIGAALGAWQRVGPTTLSVHAGASELERSALFAEIAVAWRR